MSLNQEDIATALSDAWDALDWEHDTRVSNGSEQEWIDRCKQSRDMMERLEIAVRRNPALAEAIIEALKEDDE